MKTVDYLLACFEEDRNCFSGDYPTLQALLHSLSEEERQLLLRHRIAQDFNMGPIIRNILSPKKTTTIYNETIEVLLGRFVNKRSRQVMEARKELCRRFPYLSYGEQTEVLKTFLCDKKSARKWALAHLEGLWSETFQPLVCTLWETHQEEECGKLVAKYFPVGYVKAQREVLSNVIGYKLVCLRLGQDPDYVIEQERLSDMDYLYVMAKLGRDVEAEEAERILYQFIASYLNHPTSLFRYEADTPRHGIKVRNPGEYTLLIIPHVKFVVWCLGRLGLGELLIDFHKWNRQIQGQLNEMQPVRVSQIAYWERKQVRFEAQWEQAWTLFCEFAVQTFPAKYRSLLSIQEEPCGKEREDIIPILSPSEKQEILKKMMAANPHLPYFLNELGLE